MIGFTYCRDHFFRSIYNKTNQQLLYIKVHTATRWTIRHSLMLHWFADLMNVTEEVTIHRPNVSTLLSSAFIRGDLNAATRGPLIWSLISGLFSQITHSFGKISDSTYKMLYSSDGLCPRFYGLPKIHKPGIPLRPIVSFVNSPTYAISYGVKCPQMFFL